MTDEEREGYWSYRVVTEETTDGLWYSIRECFFDANDLIWGCSSDPDPVCGESTEEIRQSLEWMLDALKYPPVRIEDIPQRGAMNPADDLLDGEWVDLGDLLD